ncbi:MAG TPA: ATP-dependent Clp protease ATP-binding subunit ClpX, partial [Rhodobacterales bacterium]|nr:ATP-dependent Clp protease ATP-binding subunit ClpX [Rhodobacterales bacterium]
EDILLDTMFDLPGLENVDEVVVNEEAVTSDAKPLIIYAEAKEEQTTAS